MTNTDDGGGDQKEQAFLDDLLIVMQKHGMALSSCGCCGGIWLLKASDIVRHTEYEHGYEYGYDDVMQIRYKELRDD